MPSLTLNIPHDSPKSRNILYAIYQRISASNAKYQTRHTEWRMAEETALAYLPEDEITRHKKIERDLYGKPEVTKIRIPYSYGVLMASHTYWTTVFLSRTPVFQFTGRHGESERQTQALEALIDYQVQVGEMLVPLYLWLLDAGKYGLGVMSVDWVDEFSMVSQIEEVPVLFAGLIETGKTKKQKINRRVKGYSGHRLTNIRPYDFFPDPRVAAKFYQKGEFCGIKIQLGWNEILKRTEQGYYNAEIVQRLQKNVEQSFSLDTFGSDMFGTEGSSQVELPAGGSFDFREDSIGNAKKNAAIILYEICIELVPADWQLGSGKYPEKWMFTVTKDFKYLLGTQPLGANHDKFPYVVLEYEPESSAINARSIGEVLKPINDTMDWLINSHLFNVRKALNDQFVVDPSQLILSDLENPLPGGAIRMSPAAYGRDARQVLQQLPITDVTRTHLTDLNAFLNIGQRTVGVNDQLMGQISPTGRRSATEVRTGTGFGINRLKTVSEYFSAMGWSPLASMMVQNSQQYFDGMNKFKIVGQLMQEAGKGFIDVTPEEILGFYDFVPVDGTMPIDRLAQAQLWNNLMGQLRNFPEIMMQYDIGRIFEWVAQLAGLKNISQFKVQLMPDQMLQQQAQAGNVVPVGGGSGASSPGQPNGASPPPVNFAGGGPQEINQ